MLWYCCDHFGLNSKRHLLLSNLDWISKGTYYLLSRIEFQKGAVSEALTHSDCISKGTCYWLSRFEFQKVNVTNYLGLNSKRYLLYNDYLGLNLKRYMLLTISGWITKFTCCRLSPIEFQKVLFCWSNFALNSIGSMLAPWIRHQQIKGGLFFLERGLISDIKRYHFCWSNFTLISKGTILAPLNSPPKVERGFKIWVF